MSNWISKQVIQTGWGSGTPWWADTQIQFNDWGAFGWDARLYFDKSTWGATWGDFSAEAWVSVDWGWAGFYAQGWRVWSGWIVQSYSWNWITTDSDWWDFEFTSWNSWPWDWDWWRYRMIAWGALWAWIWGWFTLGAWDTQDWVWGGVTIQWWSASNTGDWWLIYFQWWNANGWIWWNVEFQPWAWWTKGKFLFRQTSWAYAWELDLESLTANQTYTLQDWSWTLAFLSQIGKDEFWLTVDWAGAVVTTGSKWFRYMWYDGTITGWNVTSDVSWSIVFDIKRSGASIAGTEKPTLSSQSSNSDLTLTTWTTAITAWDELEFIVDSASTVTRATLTILITKAP